jgi:dolichol-phosphate mannosyltransferase
METLYNIGIVTPTYNEKDNILDMLNLLNASLSNSGLKCVILVMDDSSPDGTSQIVSDYISNFKSDNITLELKVRAGKQGLATAYTQGFAYLIEKYEPEFVMSIDADLSHNPKYIPKMYQKAIIEQADLVVGSRYVKGGGVKNWGIDRKVLSKGGSLYAKTILGVGINDFTSGFNLYNTKIFKKLDLDKVNARGYFFLIEMKYKIYKLGFKVVEFPIVFVDRVNGASKMSKSIFMEAVTGVIKLRFAKK